MKVSIDDEDRHENVVIQNFMKELCRRDNEANRDHNIDMNGAQNVFSVEDIRQQVLGGYTVCGKVLEQQQPTSSSETSTASSSKSKTSRATKEPSPRAWQ